MLPTRRRGDVVLATVIPRDEILAHADRVRDRSILISLLLLTVAAVLVLWISHNISRSMRGLAREAEQIRRFKLHTPVSTRSRIAEVDELGRTMAVMKDSLSQFFEISRALSVEKDPRRLLEMILREACKVSHARQRFALRRVHHVVRFGRISPHAMALPRSRTTKHRETRR